MFPGMKPLLVFLVLLAGCRPADGGSQTPRQGASTGTRVIDSATANALLERADAARIQGDTAAPVWLVELSDFQCPFCKRWHDETYPLVKKEYIDAGIVRMAYVHLPLSMHQHAQPAAEAAMCAAAQGRFWPVHDALFDTQERWTPMPDANAFFDSLAVASGIDASQYRACRESGVMRRLISADVGRAAAAGVRPTPTFFVGNEKIEGAAPIAEFRAAIARARARAVVRPRP